MRKPQDKQEQKLIADIERYGWHVIKVLEDEKGPGFAYSIGLFHRYAHPEILVIGLRLDSMHGIINGIGEQIKTGERFVDGTEYSDILRGYDCAFRNVDRKFYKDYLGCALGFYEDGNFPVLQCVWPDKQSKFPWDDGFHETLALRQPVLDEV